MNNSNPTSASPFSQFNPSTAFGGNASQAQNQQSSTEFLQPQQTGFGGSSVKPFKPTSSFGSQLLDGLPPVSAPTSPTGASSPQPTGGMQNQMTGFPGMGQQSTGTGAQPAQGTGGMGQFGQFGANGGVNTGTAGGVMSGTQATGVANPFRQNSMPTGGAGGGMGNMQFGGQGAFGANSPFAGQNQPGQGQGFGQGNFGQQGGSLI
jgi:hypothetical protein